MRILCSGWQVGKEGVIWRNHPNDTSATLKKTQKTIVLRASGFAIRLWGPRV